MSKSVKIITEKIGNYTHDSWIITMILWTRILNYQRISYIMEEKSK